MGRKKSKPRDPFDAGYGLDRGSPLASYSGRAGRDVPDGESTEEARRVFRFLAAHGGECPDAVLAMGLPAGYTRRLLEGVPWFELVAGLWMIRPGLRLEALGCRKKKKTKHPETSRVKDLRPTPVSLSRRGGVRDRL